MAEKKIDPMEALKSKDCKLRNAAMVYLHEDRQVDFNFLSEITGLKLSTVVNYVRSKFCHLIEWAREIFLKGKAYIQKKIKQKKDSFYVYIDKITMPNGEVWTKIGQTSTTPAKRAANFCWSKNGQKIYPAKVEILWDCECKDATAMNNLEDCLRIGMTALQPDKFEKNDRLLYWEDDYPQRILKNDFVKMGLTQFAA